MNGRFRGFLLLFGAAAVVGAYDAVTSYMKHGAPTAPPSAIENPVVAPPRAASRDEQRTALATLEKALGPEPDRACSSAAELDAGAADPAELRRRGLERLEVDQRIVSAWDGPPEHAFDDGTPLSRAKRDKQGLFAEPGEGLPLFRRVAAAVAAGGDADDKRRFGKQLGVLIYRYELERTAYASLLARHPEQGTLIRARQLQLFAELLHTLGVARSLGLTEPASEGGRRVDQTIRSSAADLALAVDGLDKSGVFAGLDKLKSEHEARYLELVSAGCHGIVGLRAALLLTP